MVGLLILPQMQHHLTAGTVDHGKSTLTDSLVQRAGIISAAKAGEAFVGPSNTER